MNQPDHLRNSLEKYSVLNNHEAGKSVCLSGCLSLQIRLLVDIQNALEQGNI